MFQLVSQRHVPVYPVYGESAPLHASEPRHLTLCELVYGYLETPEHFVAGDSARHVFRHIFIFQTIIDKVLRSRCRAALPPPPQDRAQDVV